MNGLKRWLGLGCPEPELRVLMVCSGNICRSPTAEGVLRARLAQAGLAERVAVDSAGIQGLHAGEAPDPRTQAAARRRGYDLGKLRARKVKGEDFQRFQRIVAMDRTHERWLLDAAPADSRARVELLMAHARQNPGLAEVPDPYYGAPQDFERVLDLVEDACDGLVEALRRDLSLRGRSPNGR